VVYLGKKLQVSLLLLVIISASIGFSLAQYLNNGQILTLEKTNNELQKKIVDQQSRLDTLQSKIDNLPPDLDVPFGNPPIVTRLGVKVMDDGMRYKYYLWVTGEVSNKGNFTAYNTTILFALHTANGDTLRAINMGTFAPFQVLPFRYQVYATGEFIESWEITPEASYVP
jgi:hypothetical protein